VADFFFVAGLICLFLGCFALGRQFGEWLKQRAENDE
jgi:hypothetical protein